MQGIESVDLPFPFQVQKFNQDKVFHTISIDIAENEQAEDDYELPFQLRFNGVFDSSGSPAQLAISCQSDEKDWLYRRVLER